jgi:AraC family transcriptional regulator
MPEDAERWYIAGIEEAPADMVSATVPAQKYAVFAGTLPQVSATHRRMMEDWQARSGYEHAEAPDFELYDEKWDLADPMHSAIYVYWPIR